MSFNKQFKNPVGTTAVQADKPEVRVHRHHAPDDVIGNVNEERRTRITQRINYRELAGLHYYTFRIEHSKVEKALQDEHWINAMQEELVQFERNEVWTLVERPDDINIIGTKWVFQNKSDENGNMTIKKARLVGQGYTQVEGVDFSETFSSVPRLEAVRLLLSIAYSMGFKLYQMDVKSAF